MLIINCVLFDYDTVHDSVLLKKNETMLSSNAVKMKCNEDKIKYRCKFCRNIYCDKHIINKQCIKCLYRNEYKQKEQQYKYH